MFSGGLFQATPGMREALTGPGPSREWLEDAKNRCQRRMHSTDTATLQAEIDQLRVYVAVLFQLLISRQTFTEEEVLRMVAELNALVESGDLATRDMVTGKERPPEENPFQKLAPADAKSGTADTPQQGRGLGNKIGIAVASLVILTSCILWVAVVAGWVRV